MPVPALITALSTTAGSNSPGGSESTITVDDYIRALSAFLAQLRDGIGFTGSITSATALRIGGGTLGIIGTRTSGGSGLTPSSACDDIVIDSGIDAGLTVLSGAANFSRLAFGTAVSPTSGRVQYDNAAQALSLWAGNAEAVRVSTNGNVSIGRTSDGGAQLLVDRLGTGTIPTLNAGTVAVFAGCSLPGSPSVITMIAGNASESGVRFGDTDADDSGEISYNHATDTMTLAVDGATAMTLTDTGVTAAGTLSALDTIGYADGAGGTFAQATSTTTAVTVTGGAASWRINTFAGSYPDASVNTFTVNNSKITDSTIVLAQLVNIASFAVNLRVGTVTAGSCVITLENTSGFSLSGPFGIKFALLGIDA